MRTSHLPGPFELFPVRMNMDMLLRNQSPERIPKNYRSINELKAISQRKTQS
jgi:hypothetical protein